jgi:hypothetical protein
MKRSPDLPRLTKEMVLDAAKLSAPEARFLVSNYYQAQEERKRNDMQLRHLGDKTSPLLHFTADTSAKAEQQVQRGLEKYAEGSPVGRWLLAQFGVGPVIAAGLLAHLDVTKSETAGGFWKFAGHDPSTKWEKGQKRPWNAELKQLGFHFGECAKRSSGSPDSFYGKFYRERKAQLVARNEAGGNAERAKTYTTQSADVRAKLAEGKLPDGNIDRQACNITFKMFLSHLHAVMYWDHYGKAPPKPFAIAVLGHAHEVRIPHIEMFPGFAETASTAANGCTLQ